MVLTILEATVAPERASDLEMAFRAAGTETPPGLVRSLLVCSASDGTRWRIETLWTSRDALAAMRQAGTPAGVLMFRAAGAEPSLSIYDVVATIEASPARG
ncbi:MAG: antibiotic biosynthesis monooxygenase family protein [Gemmatimonadaceae bacterium]